MRVNLLIAMIIFRANLACNRAQSGSEQNNLGGCSGTRVCVCRKQLRRQLFRHPGGALDPRLTGANRWTGLKYNGSGTIYQQSLGYIDNGYNTGLYTNWKFDMWLENSPVSSPLTACAASTGTQGVI